MLACLPGLRPCSLWGEDLVRGTGGRSGTGFSFDRLDRCDCLDRPELKVVPDTAAAAWPWQANFFVDDEQICGGTLVHPSYVLTEKSCAMEVAGKRGQVQMNNLQRGFLKL